MKQVYFATANKGKLNSVRNILSEYDIRVIQFPVDLPEPRTDDIRKIANEKILFAYKKIKKPCIAQDTGLYIHSLKGFPKAFVNFILQTIGINGIMKLVDKNPRECEFRECLAYLDSKLSEPMFFESKVEGKISEEPRGEMNDYFWSELSLIFIPKGSEKTLGEMLFDEFQEFRLKRHEDSFARKFAEWYCKR